MIAKKILPVLLLLLISVLFFLPYFLNSRIPYAADFTGSDLTELNLPLRFLAAESWKNGEVPLWTNLLSNGFPILAEGQAGVFYPLNLILFTQLPFGLAVNFTFLINFFLAGLFVYLYCRELKISQLGSIFAAVAFSFSGFFIFRLKHLNLINAAIWLPLVLYLIEKYFKAKRKDLVIISLAVIFSIQFFAGHPQIFYLSIISGFIYFCLKIFLQINYPVDKLPLKIFLPWLFLGLIIFGLVSIQLLPTFFNSAISGRSMSMNYSDIMMFPYSISDFSYFVNPYFFGNPAFNNYPKDIYQFGIFWENNIYFGIIPLLLALFGIFFLVGKNKNIKLLVVFCFISLFLVFADNSPFFIIFWNIIPGFKMFRFPQRFLLVTLVCLTAISGFGFDYILNKVKSYKSRLKIPEKSKILLEVLLPMLIILITAVDLFLVSFNYVGFLDYQKYLEKPKSVEFLEQDQDFFRVYSFNWPGAWNSINNLAGGWQNNLSLFISGREMLWPNLNVFWQVPSAQDRASFEGGMLIKEIHNLGNQIAIRGFKEEENIINVSSEVLKVLGLQNVKYIFSFRELKNDNLALVKEIRADFLPPLKVYKNNFFLPLSFGVFKQINESDSSQSLELIFSPNFDPSREIIIADRPLLENTDGVANIEIISHRPQKIELKADFNSDGYLFLSLPFYPGWRATVDGEVSKILKADYAFTALKLGPGNHLITFEFKPIFYDIGKWISFSTLIILAVYLLYSFINPKKKNE